MANKMFFNDLVKGNYGRKIAYADVEEVTENNIVSIIGKTLGIFNYNRRIVELLQRRSTCVVQNKKNAQ